MVSKDEKYFLDDNDLWVESVGSWAKKKHKILADFVQASSATRKRFSHNNPAFIDVFCGPGRCKVRDSTEYIDGGAVVAFKQAISSGSAFSQVHISDANESLLSSAESRLVALSANVHRHAGPAASALRSIVPKLNPHGLHFAFLDPYSLGSLSFSLFETLAQLKYIDILVHVSVFDLQRNIERYSHEEYDQLDQFAPGWREAIGSKPNQASMRAELIQFWSSKVESLGLPRAEHCDLISAPGGQRLYWLMFLSRSDFARTLWKKIRKEAQSYTLFD
jgi:three-Cys-motif partner protein